MNSSSGLGFQEDPGLVLEDRKHWSNGPSQLHWRDGGAGMEVRGKKHSDPCPARAVFMHAPVIGNTFQQMVRQTSKHVVVAGRGI